MYSARRNVNIVDLLRFLPESSQFRQQTSCHVTLFTSSLDVIHVHGDHVARFVSRHINVIASPLPLDAPALLPQSLAPLGERHLDDAASLTTLDAPHVTLRSLDLVRKRLVEVDDVSDPDHQVF